MSLQIPPVLRRPPTRRERGMALLLVMIVTTTLLVMGGMFMATARAELMSAAYYRQATQSEQYALVGLHRAMAELYYDIWASSENIPFKTARHNPNLTRGNFANDYGVDPSSEATYRNLMLRDRHSLSEEDEADYGNPDGVKDAAYWITQGTVTGIPTQTNLVPISYQRGFWNGESWAVWLDNPPTADFRDGSGPQNLEASCYRKPNTDTALGGLGFATRECGDTDLHREARWLRACAFRSPYDYMDDASLALTDGTHYISGSYDGAPTGDAHDAHGFDVRNDARLPIPDGDVDWYDRYDPSLDMDGNDGLDDNDHDYRNYAWFQLLCDSFLPETTDVYDCFQDHLHLDDRDTFDRKSTRSSTQAQDGLIPPPGYDYNYEKISHLMIADSFYRIFRFDLVYYDPAFEKDAGYRYPYDRSHTGFGGSDVNGDLVPDPETDPMGDMLNINDVNNDYNTEVLYKDTGSELQDYVWYHKKEAKWIYVYQPTLSPQGEYIKPGRYAVTVMPDCAQVGVNAMKSRTSDIGSHNDIPFGGWFHPYRDPNPEIFKWVDFSRQTPVRLGWKDNYGDYWHDEMRQVWGGEQTGAAHQNYSNYLGSFANRAEYTVYLRKNAWGSDVSVALGGNDNDVPNDCEADVEYHDQACRNMAGRTTPFGFRYSLNATWDIEKMVLSRTDRRWGKPTDGTAGMAMLRRNTRDGVNDAGAGNPGYTDGNGSWVSWDEGDARGGVSTTYAERAAALRKRFIAYLDQVEWNPGYRPPSGEHKVLDYLFQDSANAPSVRRRKFRAVLLTNILSGMNWYNHGDHEQIMQIAACPNGHAITTPLRLDYSDPDKMVDVSCLDPSLPQQYVQKWHPTWTAGGCPACGERMYLNEYFNHEGINEVGKIYENFWDARRDVAAEAAYFAANPGASLTEALDNVHLAPYNASVPLHYGGLDKAGGTRNALQRFFVELMIDSRGPASCGHNNRGRRNAIARADDEVGIWHTGRGKYTYRTRAMVRQTTNDEVRTYGLQPEPLFRGIGYTDWSLQLLIWDPSDGTFGRWHDVTWYHNSWNKVKKACRWATFIGDFADYDDPVRCHGHPHVHAAGQGTNTADHDVREADPIGWRDTEDDGGGTGPSDAVPTDAERYKWRPCTKFVPSYGGEWQDYKLIRWDDPVTPDPAGDNSYDQGYFWWYNASPTGVSERVINGPGSQFLTATPPGVYELQPDVWDGVTMGTLDGAIDAVPDDGYEQKPTWATAGAALGHPDGKAFNLLPAQPASADALGAGSYPTGLPGRDFTGGGFHYMRQAAYEFAERGADLAQSLAPNYDPASRLRWTGDARPAGEDEPVPCLAYAGDRNGDDAAAETDFFGGGYVDADADGSHTAGEVYVRDWIDDFPMNWSQAGGRDCLGWDEGPMRLRCDPYYMEEDPNKSGMYHGQRLIDAPIGDQYVTHPTTGKELKYYYWAYPERPVRVYGGECAPPYMMKNEVFKTYRPRVSRAYSDSDRATTLANPAGVETDDPLDSHRWTDADYAAYTAASAGGRPLNAHQYWYWEPLTVYPPKWTDDALKSDCWSGVSWDNTNAKGRNWEISSGSDFMVQIPTFFRNIGDITTECPYCRNEVTFAGPLASATVTCPIPLCSKVFTLQNDPESSRGGYSPRYYYRDRKGGRVLNNPEAYITITFDTRFKGTKLCLLHQRANSYANLSTHGWDPGAGGHGYVKLADYVELRDPDGLITGAAGTEVNMSAIPVGKSWQARNMRDNRTNYVDGYTSWDLMDITITGETADSRLDEAVTPAGGKNCSPSPQAGITPGIHYLTDQETVAAAQNAATGLRISSYVDVLDYDPFNPGKDNRNFRNRNCYMGGLSGRPTEPAKYFDAATWDESDLQTSWERFRSPSAHSNPGASFLMPSVGADSTRARWEHMISHISNAGGFMDDSTFLMTPTGIGTGLGPGGLNPNEVRFEPFSYNSIYDFYLVSDLTEYFLFHTEAERGGCMWDWDFTDTDGDGITDGNRTNPLSYRYLDDADAPRQETQTLSTWIDWDGDYLLEQTNTTQGDYTMDMRLCIALNVNELYDEATAQEAITFGYGAPPGYRFYGMKPLRGYPSIGWNYTFAYEGGWFQYHKVYRWRKPYDPDHDRTVDYYSTDFGGGSGDGWQSDAPGGGRMDRVHAGVSPVHTLYVTGQSLGHGGEPMGEVRIRCTVERTWDGRMRILDFNWLAQDIGFQE